MNNKQLAEMIKDIHKQKLNEYRSRSMSQPPARKGSLTPGGHMSHSKQTDITKAGPGVMRKYKPGKMVSEEDKEEITKTDTKAKKFKNIINTTPEQDSAMIGTQ